MLALLYSDTDKSVKLDGAYPMPQPGPGEALIKVHRAGVCATVRLSASMITTLD